MTPEQALQTALAAEHAALYLTGVVGGRVSASADPELWATVRAAYTAHRARRDQLTAMVEEAGADPVPAEVGYALPNPARTPAELRALALDVQQRCAAVYADVVGSTSGPWRRWALTALEDCAVRSLGLGGGPEAFPGAAEL